MKRLFLAALIALPLPAAAQDWCASGRLNPTEQTICSDPFLGALDEEMNAVWSLYPRSPAERREQNAWRSGRRDACGYDAYCIEQAYGERLLVLDAGAPAAAPKRPWCAAPRLNEAERAVCADDRLADLDAAMEAVYGAAKARARDDGQQAWLRRRDGCGADQACIGAAYLGRIIELGGRLRAR